MNGYEKVLLSRSGDRPTAVDYISGIFEDFFELHGDRQFGDDSAIIGGIARLNGMPVTVIATEKGKDTEDRIRRNFGSAKPEGYRKALRLMKQAEKFHRPVICFVDTAGAYCGIEAEQRGQGRAIAENLYEMSALATPILSVMIGEGGSGGALALALADRILMNENAYYSVVSPEGCASILWKDSAKVKEAADALKLSAEDLKAFGMIDEIVPDGEDVIARVKAALTVHIADCVRYDTQELLAARYQKFRQFGRCV